MAWHLFPKCEVVDGSFGFKRNEAEADWWESISLVNVCQFSVAWQAHRSGSHVFIRLINIPTLTLWQCHGAKKPPVGCYLHPGFLRRHSWFNTWQSDIAVVNRSIAKDDYRRPCNRECTLRSFSPACQKIHPASRGRLWSFGTQRRGSFVSDARHEAINGLPVRRRQARREGRFRGNHRRTANCRATRRKSRENLLVWAEVFARRSIGGGSVRLTRSAQFVRRAKVTFIRLSLFI